MSLLVNVLITFVVVILILYLVNLLPLDGRAKQIVRVIVIVIGIIYLLRHPLRSYVLIHLRAPSWSN